MKRITLSAFTLMLVIGIVGAGTFAWFTSTETTEASTFTAGTLVLDETGFKEFDLGDIVMNMAPGDVSDEVTITIRNDGTLPLAWFGDWVFTGGKLKEAIYFDYARMDFVAPNDTVWEPTGSDNFISNGRGSGEWPKAFNDMADLSPFDVLTLNIWDGNNHMCAGPYEHMGALMPGYEYQLTVKFGFAEGAGNEYQGGDGGVLPVGIRFKVHATQVNVDALNEVYSTYGGHYNWMMQQLEKQG